MKNYSQQKYENSNYLCNSLRVRQTNICDLVNKGVTFAVQLTNVIFSARHELQNMHK
jgi:hypothetical protein